MKSGIAMYVGQGRGNGERVISVAHGDRNSSFAYKMSLSIIF